MTSKLITAMLIAATLLPANIASAQTRELHRDRRDIREEQRERNQALRRGDYHDAREETRDVRDARQEYRDDRRDYYRGHHYAAFRAPFRYTHFTAGVRIAPYYWAPPYRVDDVARWRLAPAGAGFTYVRHYDDLLLVNIRTGRVVRVFERAYR